MSIPLAGVSINLKGKSAKGCSVCLDCNDEDGCFNINFSSSHDWAWQPLHL